MLETNASDNSNSSILISPGPSANPRVNPLRSIRIGYCASSSLNSESVCRALDRLADQIVMIGKIFSSAAAAENNIAKQMKIPQIKIKTFSINGY